MYIIILRRPLCTAIDTDMYARECVAHILSPDAVFVQVKWLFRSKEQLQQRRGQQRHNSSSAHRGNSSDNDDDSDVSDSEALLDTATITMLKNKAEAEDKVEDLPVKQREYCMRKTGRYSTGLYRSMCVHASSIWVESTHISVVTVAQSRT